MLLFGKEVPNVNHLAVVQPPDPWNGLVPRIVFVNINTFQFFIALAVIAESYKKELGIFTKVFVAVEPLAKL